MEFKPKKKLGQNFLINDKILDKIVKVGDITNKDNILEIGPGTGNLTKYLIKAKPKSIVVIEKDTDLINQLKQRFEDSVKVINEDVLKLNENFFTKKFKVFGNLPYNISTRILSNWCLSKNIRFEKLILMFQKEVADRIISKENTKNYSRITILANWKFDIKKKFDINPGNFYPAPKIQSSVLEFIPKKKIYKIKDPRNLEHLTRV
jgi:dimethyladenosine transferase